MPRGREKNSPLALVLVTGVVGYFFWRLVTPNKDAEFVVSGKTKKPRTNEDIARHWDKMADQCEADAKNPRHREVRTLNLELAADARKRAAATRAGRGAWDEDE